MIRWSWSVSWILAGTLAGCASAPLEKSPNADLMLLGLDGKLHGPLELQGESVHVVVFISHDCPIANSYAPTLKRLMARYQSRPVVFYLVHVDPDLDVTTAPHAAGRERCRSWNRGNPLGHTETGSRTLSRRFSRRSRRSTLRSERRSRRSPRRSMPFSLR